MFPLLDQIKQQLMVEQFIHAGLESILNQGIKKTAGADRYLYKLDNKVLAIDIPKMQLNVVLFFSKDGINVLKENQHNADCQIKIIDPKLLLQLTKHNAITSYLNDHSILLEGDIKVIQEFTGLIEFLEKDPAEILSDYIGDVAAYSLVRFIQQAYLLVIQKRVKSRQYWGERLTEEWKLLSPKLAILSFCDEVEKISKQTAQLEKKIAQLATMLTNH